MALVGRAMEAFDLRRKFKGNYANLETVRRQGTAEMLEQLIALRLLGGPGLRALFDGGSIAYGAIFGRRLKRFSWWHNDGLQ
jgi:hypothetical protein